MTSHRPWNPPYAGASTGNGTGAFGTSVSSGPHCCRFSRAACRSAASACAVVAFLIDASLFTATFALSGYVIYTLLTFALPGLAGRLTQFLSHYDSVANLAFILLFIIYFAVMERGWGCTPGKWLTGLRVTVAGVGGPPSFRHALVRSILFYVIAGLPSNLIELLQTAPGDSELIGPAETLRRVLVLGTTTIGTILGSVLILVSTMRARSGYRGPHEWISGTQVVRLRGNERRRAPRTRRKIRPAPVSAHRPIGVLETLGPYSIRGAVRWEPERKVLLGEDTGLGRQVWIVLRPREAEPPRHERRELARMSRRRWLTGGEQGGARWDAYNAPAGCSLADLAGLDGLPWREVRPILEDLVEELEAACGEGSLPAGLSVDQVWIQPDGRAILVDALRHRRALEFRHQRRCKGT